jgi:hypothetical protein
MNGVIGLVSPFQLKMMPRNAGKHLSEAGASFKFGPLKGPDFLVPNG